jgi:hypothetical protein
MHIYIQTVGDSYVGITNLVEDQNDDHAARMARFALDAIEVCVNAFEYIYIYIYIYTYICVCMYVS